MAKNSADNTGAASDDPNQVDERKEKLKAVLYQKRQVLQEEVSKYLKGTERDNDDEAVMDEGDLSVKGVHEDFNLKRMTTHRETLLKIDDALRKIDNDTYGTCEECEEEINPERLRVVPFAIYCRDCKENIEKAEQNTNYDDITIR